MFVLYGLSPAMWFYKGTLWLAVPSIALCLISLVQGIWAQLPEDAQPRLREGGKEVQR